MGEVRCYINVLKFQYAMIFLSNLSLFMHTSEHKDLIKKISTRNVEKRHKDAFVGWFADKVSRNFITLFSLTCISVSMLYCNYFSI